MISTTTPTRTLHGWSLPSQSWCAFGCVFPFTQPGPARLSRSPKLQRRKSRKPILTGPWLSLAPEGPALERTKDPQDAASWALSILLLGPPPTGPLLEGPSRKRRKGKQVKTCCIWIYKPYIMFLMDTSSLVLFTLELQLLPTLLLGSSTWTAMDGSLPG